MIRMLTLRFRNPFWRVGEFFSDSTAAPTKVIKDYLDPIVQEAIDERKQNEKDGVDSEETLLQHLVKSSTGEEYRTHSFTGDLT